MPNTQSAKKALRQNEVRYRRNLTAKRQFKDMIKQYKKRIAAGNIEEAKNQLPSLYKTLDKSAKAGVIKKNKASRLKSRLASKLQSKDTPRSAPKGEVQ